MKPLIVKLGGSVVTDKGKKFTVKFGVLRRLARELATYKGPLVVIHGGGSFGHPVASKYGIADGYKKRSQLMGLSLTHQAMERLNSYVIQAFQGAGIPAVPVQPSACVVVSNGRIKSMEVTPIKALLDLGVTPVLYGDAVPDEKKGISILSGDQIVVYLARKLGSPRVVLGVNVDGVFAANPKKEEGPMLVKKITLADWKLVNLLGAAGAGDVTGGMRKKVEELLELAKQGVEAEIVNATKPDFLKKAVNGKSGLGTIICRR